MAGDVRDTPLEEQYAIVLEAIADAEALRDAGSVTAAHELEGLYRSRTDVEDQLRAKHRGPAPVTEAPRPVTTRDLMHIHQDLLVLLDSAMRHERRDALARVLPYVARGEDLAFLLGYQT